MFVLFVYDKLIPTVEIAEGCYKNSLASDYGFETGFACSRSITGQDIEAADAVVIIRPNTFLDLKIARLTKASGRMLITFLDDDLLDVPDEYSLKLHRISWRRNSLLKICFISDLLISGNVLICKKYGKLMEHEDTIMLDTVVDAEDIKRDEYIPHEDGKVNIVYAAGKNHESFFNRCISPILPDLFMKYGDRLSLTFFGSAPSVPESCSGRNISYVGHMPLSEYRAKIVDGGYDIGLAPLESNDFTKCKYYNKFIEYTVSGIPGVYSDVEPFSLVVRDGENGILSQNTSSSWLESISRLIDDEALRKRCCDSAISLLKTDFSREHIMKAFAGKLQKHFDESRKKPVEGTLFWAKLGFGIERAAEIVYMFFVYLKNTGIKATIKKCREHLTE